MIMKYLLIIIPAIIFGQEIYEAPLPDIGEDEWKDGLSQIVNLTTDFIQASEPPGFRARITQKAFDYATTLAIDFLMTQVPYIEIPSIKERIGTTDVNISNVEIIRFDRPQSRIVPLPGFGISWKIWDLNVRVRGNYNAEMGFGFFGSVKKSGTLSVRTKDMSFTIEMLIGKDPRTGRPTTISPNCFSGGDLIITFAGGWANMLNVGSSVFANTVRGLIASLICSTLQTQIDNNLNSEMGTIPINETIAGLYDFNFGMTEYPTFNDKYLETSHKGAAYYHGNRVEPPFNPAFIPEFENHIDKMTYVYISDYVLNSAFYAGYLSGMLRYNISSEMLPDELKVVFSSNCHFPAICLGTVFPGLPVKYPVGTVEISVYATKCPQIQFYDGHAANMTVSGNVDLFVRLEDNRVEPLFAMNFTFFVDVALYVNGSLISFDVKSLVPDVDILFTNIGDIGTGFFYETIIRVASQSFILPKLAEYGTKGFKIPSVVGLKLNNPEIIKIKEPGVFIVSTDIEVEVPKDLNIFALLKKENGDPTSNDTDSKNITTPSSIYDNLMISKSNTVTTPLTTASSQRNPHRRRKNRNRNGNNPVNGGDVSPTPTPGRRRKGGRGRKNRRQNRNSTPPTGDIN